MIPLTPEERETGKENFHSAVQAFDQSPAAETWQRRDFLKTAMGIGVAASVPAMTTGCHYFGYSPIGEAVRIAVIARFRSRMRHARSGLERSRSAASLGETFSITPCGCCTPSCLSSPRRFGSGSRLRLRRSVLSSSRLPIGLRRCRGREMNAMR